MDTRKSYKWIVVDLVLMYIVTGIGLVVMAVMLDKLQLNSTFVEVGIVVIYVLSGLVGGFTAGRKMKTKKFLWGLLMGAAYFLILFAVSAAINGGVPKDMVHMGTTLLICMAAGTLGGMIG